MAQCESDTDELPPSYHEAVTTATCRLFQRDFWPNCLNAAEKAKHAEFDNFQSVVQRANDWLAVHPECFLLKCETLIKKVYLVTDIYNCNVMFENRGQSAVIIHGLRLWTLCHGIMSSSAVTQIGFADMLPSALPSEEDHKYPLWECMTEVVENFNRQNRECPVDGSILTAETVSLELATYGEDWRFEIDSTRCAWPDVFKRHRLNFLRVFYLLGEPTEESIGFVDFLPDCQEATGFWRDKPSFGTFNTAFSHAQEWTKTHPGIRIINLQTLNGKFTRFVEEETDTTFPIVDTKSGVDYKIDKNIIVSYLRLTYVHPSPSFDAPPMPPPPQLDLVTFLPDAACAHLYDQELGSLAVEYAGELLAGHTMDSIMDKMHRWLRRAEGARVFLVETVTVPQKFLYKPEGVRKMVRRGLWWNPIENEAEAPHRFNLVQFIRLYLNGAYWSPRDDVIDMESTALFSNQVSQDDCRIL